MILTTKKETNFVPETGGNKKLKKGEQILVRLHLPSAGEAENYTTYEYSGLNDTSTLRMSMRRDTKKIISDCVIAVENLSVQEENGTLTPIRSGTQLLECQSPIALQLVREITNTIVNADSIAEKDEKN